MLSASVRHTRGFPIDFDVKIDFVGDLGLHTDIQIHFLFIGPHDEIDYGRE